MSHSVERLHPPPAICSEVVEDDGPLAQLPVCHVGKVLGRPKVAVANDRQPQRVEMLPKLDESVGVAESHPAAAYQCQVQSHERPPLSLLRRRPESRVVHFPQVSGGGPVSRPSVQHVTTKPTEARI